MQNKIINIASAIDKVFDKTRVEYKKSSGTRSCGRMAYQLPITKIDNIYVDVYLYCQIYKKEDSNKYVENCHIETTVDGLVDSESENDFTLFHMRCACLENGVILPFTDQLIMLLSKLFSNLDKLKLTNDGLLRNADDDEYFMSENIDELIVEALDDNTNIEMKTPKECSVCYIKTNTKTNCNHQLCIRCWSGVIHQHKHSGHSNESDVPCPICRQGISCIDISCIY
jgi:hypothetical protein